VLPTNNLIKANADGPIISANFASGVLSNHFCIAFSTNRPNVAVWLHRNQVISILLFKTDSICTSFTNVPVAAVFLMHR